MSRHPQDTGESGGDADAQLRAIRISSLWRLFLLLAVMLAFWIGAAKRWWDSLIAQERMHAAGLTTQPALGDTLRFAIQQARFESALYVAGAAIVAVLAFFAYRRHDRLRRDMRMMLGRCMKCGYELAGLMEPRCPECGAAFSARSADRA